MSAFDALTKIKQAVTHPKTDHLLPKSRSLAFKTITDKAALQGTKGQHCELTHGDHWKELKGNEVSNVRLDQKITIKGNHKETLVGRCYQNIIGPHIVQNNNVRNETRLGKYTEIYGCNEEQKDQDGDISYKCNNNEVILWNNAIHGVDIAIVAWALALYGISTYAAAVDLSAILVHSEALLQSNEIHASHTEVHVADLPLAVEHAEVVLTSNEMHIAHTEDHYGHLESHNQFPPVFTPGG